MDYIEAEELAIAVLGLPEESDYDDIGKALHERFDVSFETFSAIASALMPLTIPGKSAITGELFHGFVKDCGFICKIKSKQ